MRRANSQTDVIPTDIHRQLIGLGLALSDVQRVQLARYLDVLLDANKRFNLTAIRDRQQAWHGLVLDSLTLRIGLEGLPPAVKMIDVGSGGGVPGIPMAIVDPKLQVTLLEATGKKARFLEQCVTHLSLPSVHVVQGRAENVGHDPVHRQQHDVAVCRAVGPMNRVLEYMLPLVRVGGRVLAMKGPKVLHELDEAGDALLILGAGRLQVLEAYPEGSNQDRVIVSVFKERPTPKTYPRQPGVPKRSPL